MIYPTNSQKVKQKSLLNSLVKSMEKLQIMIFLHTGTFWNNFQKYPQSMKFPRTFRKKT